MQADHSPGYEFTSRMAVHHWPVVPLFGLLDAALPESPITLRAVTRLHCF
jgi:hypothetical protein